MSSFAKFSDEVFKMPRGRNSHPESFPFNDVPKINVKIMIHTPQVLIKWTNNRKKKERKRKKKREKKKPNSLSAPAIPLTIFDLHK